MTLFIGSDHRGFPLKEQIKSWLIEQGHSLVDVSSPIIDPQDDYPDIAFLVSDRVAVSPESVGILLCGSGGGVAIAANKVKGIRAAVAMGREDVIHNRDHNNINVLALASDFTSFDDAKMFIEAFLDTPFDTSVLRFQRRLAKISAREQS
jgi:ribose 5-phosphate isomerase B